MKRIILISLFLINFSFGETKLNIEKKITVHEVHNEINDQFYPNPFFSFI